MPHPEWYPSDLHSVPPTFNDSPERMYWRTKQNLDYIYLMSYCQRRGIVFKISIEMRNIFSSFLDEYYMLYLSEF